MVALVQKGVHTFDGQFCGGAVIATHWVLTAAHCVKGMAASKIRIGRGSSSLATFIVEHQICAGVPDGTVASCGGDSGSPLVTVQNGRLVLVGVTSFGPPYYCARKGLPPVYARVSRYRTFLQSHVPGLI